MWAPSVTVFNMFSVSCHPRLLSSVSVTTWLFTWLIWIPWMMHMSCYCGWLGWLSSTKRGPHPTNSSHFSRPRRNPLSCLLSDCGTRIYCMCAKKFLQQGALQSWNGILIWKVDVPGSCVSTSHHPLPSCVSTFGTVSPTHPRIIRHLQHGHSPRFHSR